MNALQFTVGEVRDAIHEVLDGMDDRQIEDLRTSEIADKITARLVHAKIAANISKTQEPVR